MQDQTIPGQAGALRWLADLIDTHGLAARYVALNHHESTSKVAVVVHVDTAAELVAWADVLDADQFLSERFPNLPYPVRAAVHASHGQIVLTVSWWTQRIPRVVVPRDGSHVSPLCSLEPLTGVVA